MRGATPATTTAADRRLHQRRRQVVGGSDGLSRPRHTATPGAGHKYGHVDSRQPQPDPYVVLIFGQFIAVVKITI